MKNWKSKTTENFGIKHFLQFSCSMNRSIPCPPTSPTSGGGVPWIFPWVHWILSNEQWDSDIIQQIWDNTCIKLYSPPPFLVLFNFWFVFLFLTVFKVLFTRFVPNNYRNEHLPKILIFQSINSVIVKRHIKGFH